MENENPSLRVETPTQLGPPPDPTLLGEQKDDNVTLYAAVEALSKYGHELQHLQEEGQKTLSTAIERLRSNDTSIESIQHKGENLIEVLIDGQETSVPTRALSESFALSTLTLATFTVSFLLSEYFIGPLATIFIQPLGGALLASAIIPALVFSRLDQYNQPALAGAQVLLLAAAVQGLISGSACCHLTLSSEPVVPLSAVVSSFAITVADQTSRLSALKLVAGSSLGIHLTYGLISGLLSFPYIFLSLLYTGACLVPVQLGARDKKNASINYYALVVLSLTVASRGIMYGLAGMTSADLNAAAAAASANQ